ncbi:hypothetical protein QBC47DRAFT_380689 [Echria macrotheca]|uniref:Uncharacterized protein n=1 Tax=Echria macrotheca TaxID=438768 RepID=A0AAJ0BEY2_9PEZI|nr:hypothetical protein QBC47DRAFT_380689 [Echria macrotheca]
MEAPKLPVYKLPADAVWFITGCSSGLGLELAKLVASKGQRLIATARKTSDLAYLPDNDPNILKLRVDVTSSESIDAAIEATLSRFGRIDVMVNNAGYTLRGDTENAPPAAARALIETNFWGTVTLTRHALRILRSVNPLSGQPGGVILNVTSMGGRAAYPGNAFYHASKFAVEGFTESVAREVRPEWNIHLCCVEPGGVKTGFVSRGTVEIPVHEAYAAPDTPARVLEAYVNDPEASKNWADAATVVQRMYELVATEKDIPLRVPLGPDAWTVLKAQNEQNDRLLDQWREFSISAGKQGQVESLEFLKDM